MREHGGFFSTHHPTTLGTFRSFPMGVMQLWIGDRPNQNGAYRSTFNVTVSDPFQYSLAESAEGAVSRVSSGG